MAFLIYGDLGRGKNWMDEQGRQNERNEWKLFGP